VQLGNNSRGRAGTTPCVIRDLVPGDVSVTLDSSGVLKGKTIVKIAEAGETRLTWEIPAGEDFQKSQLKTPVLVRDVGVDEPRDVCAAWHPTLGWIAAWTEDGEVHMAQSIDALAWTKPQRLGPPVRSIAGATLSTLLIAPNIGRAVVVFLR